ncbi:hypothetical protein [Streptomyces sp. NPDC020489]|uniref:hypothetical protein n=1 Tax=Streptomyces sp. NPDC020489 TaxID=3365077 RepID=UPI0037BD40C0
MSTQTPAQHPTYPGRDDLNKASARARRAFAAVFKEGRRHDPKLLPDLAQLVAEAAETLNRIASDAEALEQASARHQRALKAQQDKTRALLRKAQRSGSTRGVATLERIDAYLTEQRVPGRDDG